MQLPLLLEPRVPFRLFRFASFAAAALCLSSLTAARADSVTIQVVDADGKPIAGAEGVFRGQNDTNEVAIHTDAAGKCTFEAQLDPSADSYGITVVTAPGRSIAQTFLSKNPASQRIVLPNAIAIHGKVVDTSGKPVAGAHVRLQSVNNGGSNLSVLSSISIGFLPARLQDRFQTRSGTDGSWMIDGIPDSTPSEIVELDDDRFVRTIETLSLNDPPLKIVARPGATLTGRVRAADGTPLPDVEVAANLSDHSSPGGHTTTDGGGNYKIQGLPGGAMYVDAYVHWNAETPNALRNLVVPSIKSVQIAEGAANVAPDMVAVTAGVIGGTITEAETHHPVVQGAYVGFQREDGVYFNADMDEKGHFERQLLPGKYTVTISPYNGWYLPGPQQNVQQKVTVHSDETIEISLSLVHGTPVSGIATDEAGTPIAGVTLAASAQMFAPSVTTDAQGRWSLPGLSSGPQRIVTTAGDWTATKGNEFTMPVTGDVHLILKPFHSAPLVGRIVTPDGKPLVGVDVQTMTQLALGGGSIYPSQEEFLSDKDGRFVLANVRPESHDIRITYRKPGYRLLSGGQITFDGQRFAITDAVFAPIAAGTQLHGRVVDTAGHPVAGALIAATGTDFGTGETRSDDKGLFSLAGAPVRAETRLIAAKANLYGEFSHTAIVSGKPIVLRLAPLRLTQANPEADHARAVQIVTAIQARVRAFSGESPMGGGVAYSVAPYDIDLAFQIKRQGGNTIGESEIVSMLRQVTENQPDRIAPWILPRVAQIADDDQRADLMYAIVTAKSSTPQTAMAADLDRQYALEPLPTDPRDAIVRLARRAVLKSDLQDISGCQEILTKAIDYARTNDKPDWDLVGLLAREMTAASGEWERQILPLVPADIRGDTYMRTVSNLARRDPISASHLLADMLKDDAVRKADRGQYDQSRASLEVIRELAPFDPAAASALTQQVEYPDFKAAAFMLAAGGQRTSEAAAPLYAKAIAAAFANPKITAQIADSAMRQDPKLGSQFFDQALDQLNRAATKNPDQIGYSVAPTAMAMVRSEPGVGRYLLERLFSAPAAPATDEIGWESSLIAMAWCAYDIDRAIAISETVIERQKESNFDMRNATQLRIAVFLLSGRDPHTLDASTNGFDQYGFVTSSY